MKVRFASSLLLAAALAAVPARANAQSMTLGAAPAAATTDSSGPALAQSSYRSTEIGVTSRPPSRFGWAGLGIYHVSLDVGGGATYFGLNAGGAIDVLPLAPDLPLSVFGNIALAFGGDVFFPITAGAAVHYDRLPVSLLGGLGLTVMPHSGPGDTPIGLGILGMASLPLPQVSPGLAAMAQLQYHFMDDGFGLFVFNVGATLGF